MLQQLDHELPTKITNFKMNDKIPDIIYINHLVHRTRSSPKKNPKKLKQKSIKPVHGTMPSLQDSQQLTTTA